MRLVDVEDVKIMLSELLEVALNEKFTTEDTLEHAMMWLDERFIHDVSESTGSKLGRIAMSLERELSRGELLQLCSLITLGMASDLRKEEKINAK